MIFKAKPVSQRPAPLKPFVLRIREGFLVGLGMDPGVGSPCVQCTELWLRSRQVWVEKAEVSDLKIRRDILGDLLSENSAHTYYEIANDGTATRMDCMVFPHPECQCKKTNYIPPLEVTKKTNFAFSPIMQIKCARYGTPNGNIWLTSASGQCQLSQKWITVFGAGREREHSRFQAIDSWLKRSSLSDLLMRLDSGESISAESLQSGNPEILQNLGQGGQTSPGVVELVGAGDTKEEATLDALMSLAKFRTLRKYATHMKNPMLIVGANNWLRGQVPFFLLQHYDLHLLFYPNSTPAWVVGVVALSRLKSDERPIFAFGAEADITKAMEAAIFKILEFCRPNDWNAEKEEISEEPVSAKNSKLNLWWTHWIYRCPKISLKDVLHLEQYPRSAENWRNYFGDGLEQLSVTSLNTELIPTTIRHLIKLNVSPEALPSTRNVNGIGTWANFRDSLN